MKKYQIAAILAATSTVAAFYLWARLGAEIAPSTIDEAEATVAPDPNATPHHLATRRMIEASERANGTTAPDFEATGNDGKTYRLADLTKEGPAVLIFIKDGCPCSRAADLFLKRLHTAGRGWVPFYGVIDGGVKVADRWAEQTETIFPILADPELKIIHTYGAESSAYVAFIRPGGEIEKLWAGFSETMLLELGDKMAPWVKPGMEPFEVSDAPAELYAGCPY